MMDLRCQMSEHSALKIHTTLDDYGPMANLERWISLHFLSSDRL